MPIMWHLKRCGAWFDQAFMKEGLGRRVRANSSECGGFEKIQLLTVFATTGTNLSRWLVRTCDGPGHAASYKPTALLRCARRFKVAPRSSESCSSLASFDHCPGFARLLHGSFRILRAGNLN